MRNVALELVPEAFRRDASDKLISLVRDNYATSGNVSTDSPQPPLGVDFSHAQDPGRIVLIAENTARLGPRPLLPVPGARLDTSPLPSRTRWEELSLMQKFRIMAGPGEGTCTLVLSGEADLAVADDIVQLGTLSLDDPATHRLVIDLQAVTFIDSSGLSAFVKLNNLAQDSSRRFELANVAPGVERVLTISGLDKVFGRLRTDLVSELPPDPD
jgi:anti-anti-sigma factor